MSEHGRISEPGELVYRPRPSWAPAVFAFALALAICGIFAQGFMFRGWVYSIVGIVVALFAFRGMVRESIREYYRRPRKQKARSAVLPVEQIPPPRS
jgi:hypothetical protein